MDSNSVHTRDHSINHFISEGAENDGFVGNVEVYQPTLSNFAQWDVVDGGNVYNVTIVRIHCALDFLEYSLVDLVIQPSPKAGWMHQNVFGQSDNEEHAQHTTHGLINKTQIC